MKDKSATLREVILSEAIDPELLKSFFNRHVKFERHLQKIYDLDLKRKIEIENALLFFLTLGNEEGYYEN